MFNRPDDYYNAPPQHNQYNNYSVRSCRGPSMHAPYYNQFLPTTNKQFVDNLEHALSLPADYNSENVYFDKNLDQMYNICTNGRGEKSYTILYISTKRETAVADAAVSPQVDYDKRLSELETKVEGILNGKYNVKQTDGSTQ